MYQWPKRHCIYVPLVQVCSKVKNFKLPWSIGDKMTCNSLVLFDEKNIIAFLSSLDLSRKHLALILLFCISPYYSSKCAILKFCIVVTTCDIFTIRYLCWWCCHSLMVPKLWTQKLYYWLLLYANMCLDCYE